MIDGLKITVDGSTVAQWLEELAVHYHKRAEYFKSQADTFADTSDDDMGKLSNDLRKEMQRKADRHLRSAIEVEFMRKYLNLAETYLLNASDLHTLGKASDYYPE